MQGAGREKSGSCNNTSSLVLSNICSVQSMDVSSETSSASQYALVEGEVLIHLHSQSREVALRETARFSQGCPPRGSRAGMHTRSADSRSGSVLSCRRRQSPGHHQEPGPHEQGSARPVQSEPQRWSDQLPLSWVQIRARAAPWSQTHLI